MKRCLTCVQFMLSAALLLSSCQAKPTPTVGSPLVPYQLQQTPQPSSGQPADSAVTSVVDGYLTAFKNQDWETAFQFVASPLPGCFWERPQFESLDNFVASAKSTVERRGGTLSSWEYQSVNWHYVQAQGGGFYDADVKIFRYWTSSYKELDDLYLGPTSSGSYRICDISELSY